MAKLSDRMTRADIFTDGRLLRVSPKARLLATAIEALAESTGMVRRDPDELRSAFGFYLGDSDGTPPKREELDALCDELVDAKWALDYTDGGMRLLYLQGFGRRQKGLNVCVGADSANGRPSPHLPMPACVTLEPFEERQKVSGETVVRKYLPRHCEADHTLCPCERYRKGSPTQHEGLVKGEESREELKVVDLKEVDEELSGGEAGEPVGCAFCGDKPSASPCPQCGGALA